MEVAIIPPISMSYLMGWTSIQLTLPHLLESAIHSDSLQRAMGYKILDNGAAEGYYTDPVKLLELALANNIDEVVAPDVMGDAESTIYAVRKFEPYARELQDMGKKVMGVVQGDTLAKLLKTLYFMSNTDFIDVIAIPRIVNRLVHKTQRYNLLQSIEDSGDEELTRKPFHCLGASEWLRECISLAGVSRIVRSMDTSLPIVVGINGAELSNYYPRPEGYFEWEPTNPLQTKVIEANVARFIDWCGSSSPVSGV